MKRNSRMGDLMMGCSIDLEVVRIQGIRGTLALNKTSLPAVLAFFFLQMLRSRRTYYLVTGYFGYIICFSIPTR